MLTAHEQEDISGPTRDKLLQLITQGDRFAMLLKNDIFQDAIKMAKIDLFNVIANSDVGDHNQREDCYVIIKTLTYIEDTMSECAQSAKIELERIQYEDGDQE